MKINVNFKMLAQFQYCDACYATLKISFYGTQLPCAFVCQTLQSVSLSLFALLTCMKDDMMCIYIYVLVHV